jgi:hypothetical protein
MGKGRMVALTGHVINLGNELSVSFKNQMTLIYLYIKNLFHMPHYFIKNLTSK